MRFRFTSIVALAAVVACAEPPVGPSASVAPSFGAGNAPASSGQVVRFQAPSTDPAAARSFYLFLVQDPASGLMAWHGVDRVSWCRGTGSNADVLDFQIVTNPQEARREMYKMRGEVYVSVWPIGATTCARLGSEPPLATGTAFFRLTDNDIAPLDHQESANHNAYGVMANGSLSDAAGASLRYAMTFRGNWDGDDVLSDRRVVNISLH